jgi:peptidoglycan-associated lipoprotein
MLTTKTFARVMAWTLAAALSTTACGGKKPPVPNAPQPVAAQPNPFPPSGSGGSTPPPPATPPPPPMIEDTPVVSRSADWNSKKVDEINTPDGPLRPVFFQYDSDELDDAARKVLAANAEVLKAYPTWAVTIEGHCDERGTAEYNLALGDRRALVARSYLQSIGVQGDRLRTVSYGKEFPFDPGRDEAAYAKNRRAQLMVTSK